MDTLAPGVTKTVTLGAPPGVTRGLSGTVGDSPRGPGGDIAPPRLRFSVLAENCAGGVLYYISPYKSDFVACRLVIDYLSISA